MRVIYVGEQVFQQHIGRVGRSDGVELHPCAFDDFTTNFKYLGVWDSAEHLDGKLGTAVAQEINAIFAKFRLQGITPRLLDAEDIASRTIPNWMFGHREGFQGYQYPECMLPKEENKRILLFHLNKILTVAQAHPNEIFHVSE